MQRIKKTAYGLGIVPLKECIELTGSQVFLSNEQINTIIDKSSAMGASRDF
jgi:hypothetical protein